MEEFLLSETNKKNAEQKKTIKYEGKGNGKRDKNRRTETNKTKMQLDGI